MARIVQVAQRTEVPLSGVSLRARSMPRSLIRRVMEEAMRRPGCVRLEVGEPDFDTPTHIVEAAQRAARDGKTRYAPNAGLPQLRAGVAEKLAARNGYGARPEQVVVTAGGVGALFSTLLALLEPGDEVLLPDPAWPDFRMIAHLVGARAVSYPLNSGNDFVPRVEDLDRLVSARTRVLLINSPSNPLGVVMSRPEIEAIADFAERRGLWLVADEAYDELVFDSDPLSVAAVAPIERLVTTYTFSKVYAMTGWRVGYLVASQPFAEMLGAMQEPIVTCVNTPAQFGALAALEGDQEPVLKMLSAYRGRRDLSMELLESEGLPATLPAGAFYVWVDIAAAGLSSIEFADKLLNHENVAVAPGEAFGPAGAGHVRLSLASSEESLREGIRRLGRFARVAGAVEGVAR